jgi:transcription antitermination factor NusG
VDFHGFDSQWFALQVRPRWEQKCALILRNKGYDEFLPLCTAGVYPRSGKLRAHAEPRPLFPGYLFCRLSQNVRGPVITTPGVIRVVGYGGIPTPINEEEMRNIHLLLELGRPARPHPYLQVGQKVRITAGPFREIEGYLVKVKNGHRFVVSIDPLRRSAAVEVDSDWVLSCPNTENGSSPIPS